MLDLCPDGAHYGAFYRVIRILKRFEVLPKEMLISYKMADSMVERGLSISLEAHKNGSGECP